MAIGDWDMSADTYSAESDRISFYRVTNRELVTAARIEPGMSIVDLSCGSGSTTRRILASGGDRCAVYAVDLSEKMLQQARHAVGEQSVHFVRASADEFSKYVPRAIDRVLCNAAFWHFPDPNGVPGEVRAVLKETGRFLFNIPDQQFDFGDGKWSEMARVVSTCLHGSASEPPESLPFSIPVIHQLASDNGFIVAQFRAVEALLRPGDLVRFYSIPHVGARNFPDKAPSDRRKLLVEAFGALSPDEYPNYRWAQFTLELES